MCSHICICKEGFSGNGLTCKGTSRGVDNHNFFYSQYCSDLNLKNNFAVLFRIFSWKVRCSDELVLLALPFFFFPFVLLVMCNDSILGLLL